MLVTASTLNRCSRRLWRWCRPPTARSHRRWQRFGILALTGWAASLTLTSCRDSAIATPRQVVIQQSWELAPGDHIEGFLVAAGLGDISLELKGAPVRAPFVGDVELAASDRQCIFFSSPEVPAYLFRYCGLRRPRLGPVKAGQTIGRSEYVHFATLRRQPDGTWAIVEPSKNVLERSLERY